jgi:hypothetical protein
MRNMSFALTEAQILNRSKTVTRRMGWQFLKPGDRIQAVRKGMGLKKGEKVVKLAVLEVVNVRREPLHYLLVTGVTARREVNAEGFPNMTPTQFVEMFCAANGCGPDAEITRIEFKYATP